MNKRTFIKTVTKAGLALPFSSTILMQNMIEPIADYHPAQIKDENFWNDLRNKYVLKPDYINLENGYYCITPTPTLDATIKEMRYVNELGSYYMRKQMTDDKLATRKTLSKFLVCEMEEVIITRNATEALDTIIAGYDWKAGDEAVMANQDYPAMLDMFRQQAARYGMINKMIDIPLDPKSDEEIVSLYEKQITPKTRLLMICHMINITGQILPVKKICEMAHKKGVKVLVDGAHAVAHIDFQIMDLDCDYYGTSLHKWLSVPLGAGALYVKKENISEIWPMFGDSGYEKTDIRKLNHTGTQPMYTERTIESAIRFHEAIGSRRKEERLRYLQNYWVDRVKNIKRIIINTPSDKHRSCAIANVGIEGYTPSDLAEKLMENYKIWTVAIDFAGVKGCRITPNIFTTTKELDQLVSALTELAKS